MAPERSCKATKENGEPCGAPASVVDPETGLCPAHDPERQEERRAAARKGGKATARRFSGGGLEEGDLPPLDSPENAERWLEAVGRAVATGKLGHNEGRTVVRAVREWVRARDKGKVSEKLDKMMDAISEAKESGDPTPVFELVKGGS